MAKKDFEQKYIVPQQSARYKSDAWEEDIAKYLDKHEKVTIGEVARDTLGIVRPVSAPVISGSDSGVRATRLASIAGKLTGKRNWAKG